MGSSVGLPGVSFGAEGTRRVGGEDTKEVALAVSLIPVRDKLLYVSVGFATLASVSVKQRKHWKSRVRAMKVVLRLEGEELSKLFDCEVGKFLNLCLNKGEL